MAGTAAKSKSNVPMYVATIIGLAVYAVGTYAVVQTAGGTDVTSTDSNTPNGVTVGPPAFK
ncbi:MAG: hypothetical protein JWO12_2040 [Frankiales bacterium]|nr:hypothetical protein [Frankiales bacterium]